MSYPVATYKALPATTAGAPVTINSLGGAALIWAGSHPILGRAVPVGTLALCGKTSDADGPVRLAYYVQTKLTPQAVPLAYYYAWTRDGGWTVGVPTRPVAADDLPAGLLEFHQQCLALPDTDWEINPSSI